MSHKISQANPMNAISQAYPVHLVTNQIGQNAVSSNTLPKLRTFTCLLCIGKISVKTPFHFDMDPDPRPLNKSFEIVTAFEWCSYVRMLIASTNSGFRE